MVCGSNPSDRLARRRAALAGTLGFALWVLTTIIATASQAEEVFIPVCSAAEIIALESGCAAPPSTANCLIGGDYITNQPICTFDFGARHVLIKGTSIIDVGSRSLTIRAAQFTIQEFGEIRGFGDATSTFGGVVSVVTTGNVTIERVADINVSTTSAGGQIVIDSDGAVSLAGRLRADGNTAAGIGGEIAVTAAQGVTVLSTGLISAINGSDAFSPGFIEVSTIAGTIQINGSITANGGEGGEITIDAGGDVATTADITADATGDGGDGGAIDIFAGNGIDLNGRLLARGGAGAGGENGFGGGGGTVSLFTFFGHTIVRKNILANGAVPDGDGAEITFDSAGSITIQTAATIAASTDASIGAGGIMTLDAGIDIISTGTLSSQGGLEGGEIAISAGRNVTLQGSVDVIGRALGAFGGALTVEAGFLTKGTLLVGGSLDTTGGVCGTEEGCGAGGFLDLDACDLLLTGSAVLRNRGADGGDTSILTRGAITIQAAARIDSTSLIGAGQGTPGSNFITHPDTVVPVISGTATIVPPASFLAQPIQLCATCGNNVVEPTESCDDGNAVGCDGCSLTCDLQNCNDNNPCTADSCEPTFGCNSVPVANGTACDNSMGCWTGDFCQFGSCIDAAGGCPASPTPTITPVPPTPTITPVPPSTPTPTGFIISGHIRYSGSGGSVPAADVDLLGPQNASTQTDAQGFYQFFGLFPGSWSIVPRKSGGESIGMDDALIALDVAVGLQTLASDQVLACDVTASGAVSAYDAGLMLQFVDQVPNPFPAAQQCGSDWVFLPVPTPAANVTVEQPIPGPASCQPGAIVINPLTQSIAEQNFNAVVFGDCNADWQAAP